MSDALFFDRAAWAKPVAPSLATRGTEFSQTALPFSLLYVLECLFIACITV
jgi:hypothetical protein